MEHHMERYKEFFGETPFLSEEISNIIQSENWSYLLYHCFLHNNVNLFKYIYLHTNAAFPIHLVVEMEEKCSLLSYSSSTHYLKGKEREKMEMSMFIKNLMSYSTHFFKDRKCYYQFHRKRYEDRIADLLREC